MRLSMALLAALAFSGIAQDNPGGELKHILVPMVNRTNMIKITAREILRESPPAAVDHLRGSVEIKTPFCVNVSKTPKNVEYCDGYVVLHADEADFHENSEQVEARGNVRVEHIVAKR